MFKNQPLCMPHNFFSPVLWANNYAVKVWEHRCSALSWPYFEHVGIFMHSWKKINHNILNYDYTSEMFLKTWLVMQKEL